MIYVKYIIFTCKTVSNFCIQKMSLIRKFYIIISIILILVFIYISNPIENGIQYMIVLS